LINPIVVYKDTTGMTNHMKDLQDLYSSQNIFRLFGSRRMRWAGYVVRV